MIEQMVVAVPTKEADRGWFGRERNQTFNKLTGLIHTWRYEGTASQLALAAASQLEAPKQAQCVIVVTQSPDRSCPSMAYDVVKYLDLRRDIPVFDVNQACSGFIYGLWLAAMVQRPTLLIVVDMLRMQNSQPPANHYIFSDAAAACMIKFDARENNRTMFLNDPAGITELRSTRSGLMEMNGAAVFDFVMQNVPLAIQKYQRERIVGERTCDVLVQHQANRSMMELVHSRSEFQGTSIDALDYCGNMSMVSIPAAIAFSEDQCLGEKLMLCGYGAGWGAAITSREWPDHKICSIFRV